MGPFMAIRRQSLINLSLIPGALASGLLVSVALLAFGALWLFRLKLHGVRFLATATYGM